MSLVRPLSGLPRLAARGIATSAVRADSLSTSGPSSSSPLPFSSSSSVSGDSEPTEPPAYKPDPRAWDLHTPLFPSQPVPRLPNYPTHPDAPLHQQINQMYRLYDMRDPDDKGPSTLGENTKAKNELVIADQLGMQRLEMRKLSSYSIAVKRVVNMTKKGKMASWMAIMCAGDPERGLVGIGRGRGEDIMVAKDMATNKALLSMDYVQRFENRTLFGAGGDLKSKWGATTVIMRARPPGFGLQVPHILHRIFSACGIRDASATIEGSRNEINVANAVLQILHGGFGPPGFGSGIGGRGRGRAQDKGRGMRSIQDIERERGRYGVDIAKRIK